MSNTEQVAVILCAYFFGLCVSCVAYMIESYDNSKKAQK